MICQASPSRPVPNRPPELNQLCCHEIANGPLRAVALDKPYAILVLCGYCNMHEVVDKGRWPQSRQLATLFANSPEDYDLAAFNRLVNPNAPNRITKDEVMEWYKRDYR